MSNSQTARFFDSYAHDFDSIYAGGKTPLHRLLNRYFRRSMFMRYERTLEACAPAKGMNILDVGCGPGHYSVALALMGADEVTGIDVAPAMLNVAREKALRAGVVDRCRFQATDFQDISTADHYDFVILMGFMDYVASAGSVIDKAVSMARRRALFSFPAHGGLLAWQRRLRYRRKAPLFMYSKDDLDRLFDGYPTQRVTKTRIARDYYVIVDKSL